MHERDGARGFELAGLALASLSVLGSQIALTRILSLKYAANQTFLVVSFAVLGLAVGAALAHRWCDGGRSGRVLPAAGMLLFAVALAVLTGSLYMGLSAQQQIVLVPLPFVGVGVCIAAVFGQRSAQAGFYYAVDLTGAAIGAFGAAPLLDQVPAPTAMLLFVGLGVGAAALFLPGARGGLRAAGVVVAGGLAVAVLISGFPFDQGKRIPIYPDRIKDMLSYVQQSGSAVVEDSRWSALGRTDLVDDVVRQRAKVFFLDGAAGSKMFDRSIEEDPRGRQFFQDGFGPSVALRLTPPAEKRSALAIGSGGGRDVVACRLAGIEQITAVELNADIVDMVRGHSDFNGGIYDEHPGLDVVVGEGRHFLRGSDGAWDVIVLSVPVTKRGESYGGFALSESYIFTRESMREYLDHLAPHGQLLIVCHTRQEVGRLLNTYLEAERRRREATEAMSRVGVFGRGLITVVIAREEKPDAFWRALEQETKRLQIARPQQRFYFMPVAGAGGRGSGELTAVALGTKPAVVFPRTSTSTFEPDMSPVTDDRPFFYFFTESLPPMVTVVLVVSALALLVMAGWGLRGAGGSAAEQLQWRLAVAGLGVAFMLVEVPLIQRFVFWFGQPTLALGLLLGTLLLATGIGAGLAGLFVGGRLGRTWPVVALLGAFFVVGFGPLQDSIFAGASGQFGDSLVRSLLITAPVGLLMGVPFPMLLTAAGRRPEVSVAWLWGLNGIGSVLGSAAAVAIAMMAGYSYALMLAGGVYVATAVVVLLLARRQGT